MKTTRVQHVWPLFFLPLVLGSQSGSAPGLATILILLFILLLLLILLFFSWHKLNMVTKGQYHLRNLWQRGSNGALASMAGAVTGRWRALWAEVTGASSDPLSQSADSMQPEAPGAYGHDDIKSDDGRGNQGQSENDVMDDDDYYSTEYMRPVARQATEQAGGTPTSTRLSKIPAEDTTESPLPSETEASSEALFLGHHALSGSEVSSLEGCVSILVTAV